METVKRLYRFSAPRTLLFLPAAGLTILVFTALVETSYHRWHSDFLVLCKYFLMALICNAGLFLSATDFGKNHRILTMVLTIPSLVAVPLVVGAIHTSICVASIVMILWVMGGLLRKRE